MVEERLKEILLMEFEAIPPIEELEKMYTFSERHNKMMEALFEKVRRRERFEQYFRTVGKVAIVMLALIGCAVVSLKVVPTVYAYVEAWITENADDRLIFKDKDSGENSGEKENLRFELGYVPEGYELVGENVGKTGNCIITYEHYDGTILQLNYYVNASGTQASVDTENNFVEEVNINGVQYNIFKREVRSVVIWNNGKYLFKLSGEFENKEILDIALSIKSVENQ